MRAIPTFTMLCTLRVANVTARACHLEDPTSALVLSPAGLTQRAKLSDLHD